MENVNEFLEVVKLAPFLLKYTDVNPKGGIYHRINGKATRGDKPKSITEDDKKQMREGMDKLIQDIEKVKASLDEAV